MNLLDNSVKILTLTMFLFGCQKTNTFDKVKALNEYASIDIVYTPNAQYIKKQTITFILPKQPTTIENIITIESDRLGRIIYFSEKNGIKPFFSQEIKYNYKKHTFEFISPFAHLYSANGNIIYDSEGKTVSKVIKMNNRITFQSDNYYDKNKLIRILTKNKNKNNLDYKRNLTWSKDTVTSISNSSLIDEENGVRISYFYNYDDNQKVTQQKMMIFIAGGVSIFELTLLYNNYNQYGDWTSGHVITDDTEKAYKIIREIEYFE